LDRRLGGHKTDLGSCGVEIIFYPCLELIHGRPARPARRYTEQPYIVLLFSR
jgi:predicted nucleotide-binding protein (sugar kinase/HSP70/actin superfamily)